MHRAAFSLVSERPSTSRTGSATACSCVESGGVSEAADGFGQRFEGKVTRLRHEPKRHRITARVEVLRRWKGGPEKSVDVVTIDEGSLCGFGFERGKAYLLFTPEAQGPLSVSLCSRSKPSEAAAADFAELDRLAAPGNNTPAPAPSAAPEASAAVPAAAPPTPPAAPAPSPTAAPEPNTAATPSGRTGCAGCSAPSPPRPARLSRGGICSSCSRVRAALTTRRLIRAGSRERRAPDPDSSTPTENTSRSAARFRRRSACCRCCSGTRR